MNLGEITLIIGDQLRVWLRDMDGKPRRREAFIVEIIGFDECLAHHPVVVMMYESAGQKDDWGELTCQDYVIHGIHRLKARGP